MYRMISTESFRPSGGHMRLFVRRMRFTLPAALVALTPVAMRAQAPATWAPVEQILGRTAVPQPGDVMRFNFPRRDLRVMVGDVQVKPSFALGSWVAFKRLPD